jgi:hypothetical protein
LGHHNQAFASWLWAFADGHPLRYELIRAKADQRRDRSMKMAADDHLVTELVGFLDGAR